jgi:mannose-6-phosphate isomerase-like protein (cupin superfamily)
MDDCIAGPGYGHDRWGGPPEGDDWAIVKRDDAMPQETAEPLHPNPRASGWLRGAGRATSKFVVAETSDLCEGLMQTALHLVSDTTLEPGAAIGLHAHHHSEEVWYVLRGTLTVVTVAGDGREAVHELDPGDAHVVRLGQSHAGRAGHSGARLIVVAVRPQP